MLEGRPKTFHSAEVAFVFDNADLVALTANRRNRFASALRPGTVERVVQESEVPTLVLRD